jgi:putative PIN family toxin of toxin-antitoxin system
MRIVLDTNVLLAAVRSRNGASFALVSSIPTPIFQPCLSVALYTEWMDVLTRAENLAPDRTAEDAAGFVRYLANQSHLQEIHFLWRPYLPDSDDDMVLELALAAGCEYIITHNATDFAGADRVGVTSISPADFLKMARS